MNEQQLESLIWHNTKADLQTFLCYNGKMDLLGFDDFQIMRWYIGDDEVEWETIEYLINKRNATVIVR